MRWNEPYGEWVSGATLTHHRWVIDDQVVGLFRNFTINSQSFPEQKHPRATLTAHVLPSLFLMRRRTKFTLSVAAKSAFSAKWNYCKRWQPTATCFLSVSHPKLRSRTHSAAHLTFSVEIDERNFQKTWRVVKGQAYVNPTFCTRKEVEKK